MSVISDKLIELRKENNISRQELINLLNIKYTTYANYENSIREPNSDFLIKISKIYNTSIDYLLGLTEIKSYSNNNLKLCEEDFDLINKYKKLDYYGKLVINNIIEIELERNKNNNK